MADYKCTRCGNINPIDFNIKGDKLISMTLKFQCPKCKTITFMVVEFFKNNEFKVRIENKRLNYLG